MLGFPQVRKGCPSLTRRSVRPPTVRVLSEPTAISPSTSSKACATTRLSVVASPTTSCARPGTALVCQRSTAKPWLTIASLIWLALLMKYVVCQRRVARADTGVEAVAAADMDQNQDQNQNQDLNPNHNLNLNLNQNNFIFASYDIQLQ